MKSSIPLFTRRGKIILSSICLSFIALIALAVYDTEQRPQIVSEALYVDPDCRQIHDPFFSRGCNVAVSPEDVRILKDMQQNGESIIKMQLTGRAKFLTEGTKIQELNSTQGISKIRPRGDSGMWYCLTAYVGKM